MISIKKKWLAMATLVGLMLTASIADAGRPRSTLDRKMNVGKGFFQPSGSSHRSHQSYRSYSQPQRVHWHSSAQRNVQYVPVQRMRQSPTKFFWFR